MAYVPPLNGGRINASISGNTAGALAVVSTGTMVLAGGNNVTLSQNANTFTISAANQSNQTLSFSAGSQSTLTATGTFDARSYFLNGVGAASVGFSQSSVFVSVPTQSVESQSIGMHTSTAGGGTGGTSGSASGGQIRYNFYAGSNITLSQSVNGASGSLSVYGTSGGGGVAMYDGANSITSGTARFSNSNGVSFGINGQTLTGSVAAQSNQTLSFSAGSQSILTATGTFDARSFFLNGVGGINVGFSQSSVFVSGPLQNNFSQSIGMHTSTAGGGTGGTSGSATGNAIRYNFYAGSNITLSQSVNGASGSLSVYGTSGGGGVAMYDGANSITSGTAQFSNSNGVSFGINGQTVTGSVAAQSNQTLSFSAGSQSTLTATGTFDARSYFLNGVGAASVGFSQSSVFVSVPTQTVESQSIGMHTSTAGGGTGGTSGSASGGQIRYNFYAGSNVTLSQSVNGGSGSLSVYGGAAGGIVMYDGANSITSGTARFSNSNGVSFGINGQTVTGSVAAQSNQTLGLYMSSTDRTIGQSSSTTLDARSINFSGLGALSAGFSGSTMQLSVPATSNLSATGGLNISTNGSTISVGLPLMSYWMHNSAAIYSSSSGNMANGTMSIVRMLLPGQISFSRVDMPVSITAATQSSSNTAAMAISAVGVIYSRSGSTLNPIVGQSSTTTYSFASNNGVFSSLTGPRMLSFNLATSLTGGEYYLGVQLSSATSSVGANTTNLGWTVAPIYGTSYSALPWSEISAATNQTVNLLQPLQGVNTATITNTSQTLQQSQITQTAGASGLRGNFIAILRNF